MLNISDNEKEKRQYGGGSLSKGKSISNVQISLIIICSFNSMDVQYEAIQVRNPVTNPGCFHFSFFSVEGGGGCGGGVRWVGWGWGWVFSFGWNNNESFIFTSPSMAGQTKLQQSLCYKVLSYMILPSEQVNRKSGTCWYPDPSINPTLGCWKYLYQLHFNLWDWLLKEVVVSRHGVFGWCFFYWSHIHATLFFIPLNTTNSSPLVSLYSQISHLSPNSFGILFRWTRGVCPMWPRMLGRMVGGLVLR